MIGATRRQINMGVVRPSEQLNLVFDNWHLAFTTRLIFINDRPFKSSAHPMQIESNRWPVLEATLHKSICHVQLAVV